MDELRTPPKRRLKHDDILPLEDYTPIRRQVSELKRWRRVEVGPFATFHFENFETMRHQVQEICTSKRAATLNSPTSLEPTTH